ncbi:hypothetical protein D3C87_1784000 [compost metagenome]
MGVSVENTPEGMQTQVLFLADRFALINLINGVVSTPFAIENGQTFIRSAFIQDGTITNAKIGEYIQSNNYVPGVSGWRIDKAGNVMEINSPLPGGGRMRITSQQVVVYDSNNIDRVTLGYIP